MSRSSAYGWSGAWNRSPVVAHPDPAVLETGQTELVPLHAAVYDTPSADDTIVDDGESDEQQDRDGKPPHRYPSSPQRDRRKRQKQEHHSKAGLAQSDI